MTKSDSVAARLAQLQQGQLQIETDSIGGAFDDGAASVGTGGGFSQADIDNAVAAQKAADDQVLADQKAADDADKAAAVKVVQDNLDLLQGQFTALSTKEAGEEVVVKGLQDSAAQIQAALDALKALILG